MGTKGPNNEYGTIHRDKINFKYSKDFNIKDKKDKEHYDKHWKEVGAISKEDYVEKANKFANDINLFNESFVDKRGTTYKYNTESRHISITKSDGITISYFKSNYKYWQSQKNKKEVKNATD